MRELWEVEGVLPFFKPGGIIRRVIGTFEKLDKCSLQLEDVGICMCLMASDSNRGKDGFR